MADGCAQPNGLKAYHEERKRKNRAAYIAAYQRMLKRCWINPITGCYIYDGACNSTNGYGNVKVIIDGKERTISAHRLSYIVHKGKPKRRKQVRHRCDVRPCFCPEHLVEGTQSQNMKDMMERRRGKHQFKRKEEVEPPPF